MSGRLELDLKFEQKIGRKLVGHEKYLYEYRYSFTSNTARTKLKYISDVAEFLDYQESLLYRQPTIKDMSRLTKMDINKYLNSLLYTKSDSTRAGILSSLNHFFTFLMDPPYNLSANPCIGVKRPKDKKEHTVVAMTSEEVNELKQAISDGVGSAYQRAYNAKWKKRDLAMVTIGCRTGLRVSAIAEIDLGDIDWNEKTIRVTEKGNITRKCYVGDDTLKVLDDWLKDREKILNGEDIPAVFISNHMERITSEAIRQIIKRYSGGINKHITPHKMRSTCATNLYAATGDVYLVQQTLGHKNIENTKRYTAISEEKKRKASQIMDSLF